MQKLAMSKNKDASQINAAEIVDSLKLEEAKELEEALTGEPRNSEEAKYLPLESVKLTNAALNDDIRQFHLFNILNEPAMGSDQAIAEGVLPRAIVQITVFSQVNNKRFASYSLLADTCSVKQIFDAVSSTC